MSKLCAWHIPYLCLGHTSYTYLLMYSISKVLRDCVINDKHRNHFIHGRLVYGHYWPVLYQVVLLFPLFDVSYTFMLGKISSVTITSAY